MQDSGGAHICRDPQRRGRKAFSCKPTISTSYCLRTLPRFAGTVTVRKGRQEPWSACPKSLTGASALVRRGGGLVNCIIGRREHATLGYLIDK